MKKGYEQICRRESNAVEKNEASLKRLMYRRNNAIAKCLFFVLFLCSAFCLSAQNDYQDVVYLKDGTIIRGMIIEQIPYKTLKIETVDGSVLYAHLMILKKSQKNKP